MTDFSKPIVDDVSLPGAGPLAGQQLSVHVSSELMKNQLPAAPIDGDATTVRVVQDSDGNPMIFTIGSDGTLRLLQAEHASRTGWKTVDLTN